MPELKNKNLIPIAIIIAGFVIAGAVIYVEQQKKVEGPQILSSQQIGEKVINYINKNMLQGQATASLGEIVEENGLYKIIIKVGDQEFPSYASRDGKLLFPQFIDLEEKPEVSPETPSSETPPLEEKPSADTSSLGAFAKCLTEKGMKFYGASWCGWCKKQKELFGEAVQYLPYVECIDEKTQEMTPECKQAGISGFPTWQLPDGTKSSGFKSLEDLAKLSGCQLER